MPRTRLAVTLLLLLSAVAYTAWVLEVVLSTGLDPVQAYISELAAEDQPLGGLFRATDLVAGLAVLAAALTALASPGTSAPPTVQTPAAIRSTPTAPTAPTPAVPRGLTGGWRRPWATVGWAALALFGAATAADSRLPLSCAPTSDEECAARETAGLVPATHTAHAVTSSLAMAGALLALTALTVAARRYGWWTPVRRFGPWLLAAELLATGWSLAAIAAFEAGHGSWSLGAGQRLQVLLVAFWLALLALGVSGGEDPPRSLVHRTADGDERPAGHREHDGCEGRAGHREHGSGEDGTERRTPA
ncbi:DUF998 domain-containing protein [Kitasatospora sp. NPDC004240]